MTVAKPIPLVKSPSSLDQKPALSRLSKRELEELHAAPTHYPQQDHHDMDHLPSASSLAGGVTTLLSQVKSPFQPYRPSTSLNDYGNEDQLNAFDLDVIKSQTSIGNLKPVLQDNVVEIPIGTINPHAVAQQDQSVSFDNQASMSDVILPMSDSVLTNNITKKEDEGTLLNRLGLGNDDGASSLDLEKQLDDVSPHDQKEESGSVRNLEVRGKVFAAQDAGDDTNFNETQHERAHEVTHKMTEGEENNATIGRSSIARAEIAPVTGSAGSSGPDLSDPVAAALRVTHLLDELTAAVSRLRLDSSDGKEMTIQLRRDVLPETNIHIVSTSKQMEVSFLTSNAASNLLLNTHLTTLQNHLNALCPEQVVSVQTRLAPSSESHQTGSEQEHSHDDLASFDQGNRGNESREE